MHNVALAVACQQMIPDEPTGHCAPANCLIRRADAGPETVLVTATLLVAFDLTTPPN